LFSFGDQMLDSKMWQAKRKTYIGISKMSNIVEMVVRKMQKRKIILPHNASFFL
jgi:hypothetical protein